MKIYYLGLFVFLSATVALAAPPEPLPDKGHEKNGKATPNPDDEQRQQLCLLEVLQFWVEEKEPKPGDASYSRKVRVRGTLVKKPAATTTFTRLGVEKKPAWDLAVRLDNRELVQPLHIIGKELLELAEQCAGKEVVLTGTTVISGRFGRKYESAGYIIPFLAVKVESLKLAEK